MNYPVPQKSAKAWQAHQKTNKPCNPGLIFDRFVPDWGAVQDQDREAKKKAWIEIEGTTSKGDADLLKAFNARWESTVRAAHAEPFSLKTDWRLVAGLGRKGSLEVGFTFNRYGFPVLPGSSVKGIARAYAFISLADALDEQNLTNLDGCLSESDEEKFSSAAQKKYRQAAADVATRLHEFRQIFGTTGDSGRAVFFDAVPAQLAKLELDIMNPHFPDYYGDKTGKTAPTDWQSPRPVYFLTVAPNTEFRFAVGWRGHFDSEGRRLRDQAKDWLVKGLTQLGAGAKTSAGYGYFVE